MLIDTHTHLYVEKFDEDRDDVIQRAVDKGIEKFFLPNIDSDYIEPLITLAEKFKSRCYPMMGLHPGSVKADYHSELDKISKTLGEHKFYAVGEIGMDLYWDTTYKKQQRDAFRTQIQWAKEADLPIVIHCRKAFDEILKILEEENDEQLRGIFHCFTGGLQEAKRILKLDGFYLGIGGIVTFKNAGLDKTVQQLDLENLVLETDAPYLAPEPNRGKRNESAYLTYIAERVAKLQQVNMNRLAEVTTANAQQVFRWEKQ